LIGEGTSAGVDSTIRGKKDSYSNLSANEITFFQRIDSEKGFFLARRDHEAIPMNG